MLKLAIFLCVVAAAYSAAVPKPKYYGEIIFMGDSITEWWNNDGKSVWDQNYGPLGAVNVGVAGDVTQQTIDRMIAGNIDNFNARMVVLKIGTNDLARGFDETYVSDQIGRILAMLKAYLPGVRIILLGILPRGGADIHQRVRNVNEMIRNYDDGYSIRYLNMEAQFSPGLGQVYGNLYWGDQLHLSTEGYQVWAQTMAPLFNDIYYGSK